ncbi:hypothetical protein CHUAL_001144 [Chamberlinius hualienensis]
MELNFRNILLPCHLILSITLVVASNITNEVNESSDTRPYECRNKFLDLEKNLFYLDSCVQCYIYMPESYFKSKYHKLLYNFSHFGILYSIDSNNTKTFYNYNVDDDRKMIENTIKNDKGISLWQNCCAAAARCCDKMNTDPIVYQDGSYCKRHWDGWQCIPDTLIDTVYSVPCPSYIYFFGEPPNVKCTNYGKKACQATGIWEFRTRYESCGLSDKLKRRMYVNIGAFAFSLVFLVPAVIIFFSYKQLRVPRVMMHTNLFLALIINGIVVIVYKLVIGLSVLDRGSEIVNTENCKFALALTKYTRMTTYMWMFCESFYLHKLIVTAFAEEKRLAAYYLLGWVFPGIPVAVYSIMRHRFSDEQCWMLSTEEGYEWIINAPMLFSLALNFVFLCNIIRVLIQKLHAAHSNEPSQYRKAVRATVVLVPLFGLHFLLTIYLPNHGECEAIEFYYYFSHLIDGLQGFLVSLIFCYLNGEILSLLGRSINNQRIQWVLSSQRS